MGRRMGGVIMERMIDLRIERRMGRMRISYGLKGGWEGEWKRMEECGRVWKNVGRKLEGGYGGTIRRNVS